MSKRSYQRLEGSTTAPEDELPIKEPMRKSVRKEFDILALPEISTQVEDTIIVAYPPREDPTHYAKQIVFQIPDEGDYWMLLSESELHIQYEYVQDNADGTALAVSTANENFRRTYPEVNLFDMLFSSIEVKINNTIIPLQSTANGVMAYIMRMVTSSEKDLKYLAETIGYEKETTNRDANWANAEAGVNYNTIKGRTKRTFRCGAATKTYHMRGTPFQFMFHLPKNIPPRVPLEFVFVQATPETYLMSFTDPPNVKVRFIDMNLIIKKQKLSVPDALQFERAWLRSSYKLPFNRVTSRTYTIQRGNNEYKVHSMYGGLSQTGMLVCMIDQTNFGTDYDHSTLKFPHNNLNEIYFTKNGKNFPYLGYKNLGMGPNAYIQGTCLEPYRDLLEYGKRLERQVDIDISYKEWCDGSTIFYFDLTKSQDRGTGEGIFHQTNKSPLSLNMKFSAVTTHVVYVYIISLYDSLITIDKDKQVTYNWQ